MGFCPPCQVKQWAFVQWDIVQWAFVLVGFCPSGLLSVPQPGLYSSDQLYFTCQYPENFVLPLDHLNYFPISSDCNNGYLRWVPYDWPHPVFFVCENMYGVIKKFSTQYASVRCIELRSLSIGHLV